MNRRSLPLWVVFSPAIVTVASPGTRTMIVAGRLPVCARAKPARVAHATNARTWKRFIEISPDNEEQEVGRELAPPRQELATRIAVRTERQKKPKPGHADANWLSVRKSPAGKEQLPWLRQ